MRGRDQREPGSRRLEQDDPEGILEGREGEGVGLRVVGGHLGVIDEAGELDPVEAEARRELAEAGLLRPGSHHDQADLGMLDPGRGERQKELVDSLVGDQAAGGQDREGLPVLV